MTEIFVTRPFLPPLEDLLPSLRKIWESRILTNAGPFHQAFESRVCETLGVEHGSLVSNGTLALSLAIKAARLEPGEVITTPYSFVATAHAIAAEGLTPVFVDIRPTDLNIDPLAVEAAITPRTRAILAVHCYGNPCAVEALEDIASRHGLCLIYDAAHAFGVDHRGTSIARWGNFSTMSFHATKAFNTFEGGAIFARHAAGKIAVDRLRNFGIIDEVTVESVGGNAKMNEFSAAIGLLQLDHFESCRAGRKAVDTLYRQRFAGVPRLRCLDLPASAKPNFSYFPVLVGSGQDGKRDAAYSLLKERGIHARRYFYPLLSNLPIYAVLPSSDRDRLVVANEAAQQVLCLPIYPELEQESVELIASVLIEAIA